jgi:hypothetical protein
MALRRGIVAVLVLAVTTAALAGAQTSPTTPAPKKNPLLKLVNPWPTPKEMKQRRKEAEARPLFSSVEPLAITLAADFKTINKDHTGDERKRYAGELRLVGSDGAALALPVQLSARGHVRRMARTCDYVPLRIELPKHGADGTVFAHQTSLKLVVQCAGGGDFEQYLLREYLAYRMYNVITARSFRARLAKVSYVDRASGKPAGTRTAMFIEEDSDVARRMEGRTVELARLMFADLDSDSLMPMMLFEYMIGNTDFSIFAQHNVRLIQRPDKTLHPVAYDFDFSGLVHPPYAVPARALMLTSVRDRVYRGPCLTQERIDPYLANFVAKRDLLRALIGEIPGMDKASREDARSYLDSFYTAIRSEKDTRRLFVACADKPTM